MRKRNFECRTLNTAANAGPAVSDDATLGSTITVTTCGGGGGVCTVTAIAIAARSIFVGGNPFLALAALGPAAAAAIVSSDARGAWRRESDTIPSDCKWTNQHAAAQVKPPKPPTKTTTKQVKSPRRRELGKTSDHKHRSAQRANQHRPLPPLPTLTPTTSPTTAPSPTAPPPTATTHHAAAQSTGQHPPDQHDRCQSTARGAGGAVVSWEKALAMIQNDVEVAVPAMAVAASIPSLATSTRACSPDSETRSPRRSPSV